MFRIEWPVNISQELFCIFVLQKAHSWCSCDSQVAFKENNSLIISEHGIPTNRDSEVTLLIGSLVSRQSLFNDLLDAWDFTSDVMLISRFVEISNVLVKLGGNRFSFNIDRKPSTCVVRSVTGAFSPQEA